MSLGDLWRRWLGRASAQNPQDSLRLETVRLDFKRRFENFRLLLTANSQALSLMAGLETAAEPGRVCHMSWLRAHTTSLTAKVHAMVRHLESLAPGRHPGLDTALESIHQELVTALEPRPPRWPQAPLAVPLTSLDDSLSDQFGSKLARLGQAADLPEVLVPAGWAISAEACARFLEGEVRAEINRRLVAHQGSEPQELLPLGDSLKDLVSQAPIPPEVARAISQAAADLAQAAGPQARLAVRSSALDEDRAGASMAGLHQSVLRVVPGQAVEAWRRVVSSLFSPQALRYRRTHGLRNDEALMAVGLQVMVPAVWGGVAYSADPLGRDGVLIQAAPGSPQEVVEGGADGGGCLVGRREPHQLLDARGREPGLSADQLARLARLALALERRFGGPQDLEWALDDQDRLWLLQCRPLHRLAVAANAPAADREARPLLAGVAVSAGAASGPLFRAASPQEAALLPAGCVLAVGRPLPRWAALLDRISGLAAAGGGPAGHLATLCREHGVPAVFALGPDLARLPQGTPVTLDGTGGVLWEGLDVVAAAERRTRGGLDPASPVARTLGRVLALVSPLNLKEPGGRGFDPRHCRTLHDLTRYCHESAVREMFAFGRATEFPERAAKRLFHKVPMQYWIIDLDDGFAGTVEDSVVTLEAIACQPFHHLWDGMTIEPWAGPPAAGGGGLASVMFNATANPALANPFHRHQVEKNYFLISRHFLSLQSRFGFHLASVEAMLGPRRRENYAGLTFKGGAADQSRRQARVMLLGNLLEPRGFGVERTGDFLRARLDDAPASASPLVMGVLGYLLMHTRQLDAALSSPARIAAHQERLEQGLSRHFGAPEEFRQALSQDN